MASGAPAGLAGTGAGRGVRAGGAAEWRCRRLAAAECSPTGKIWHLASARRRPGKPGNYLPCGFMARRRSERRIRLGLRRPASCSRPCVLYPSYPRASRMPRPVASARPGPCRLGSGFQLAVATRGRTSAAARGRFHATAAPSSRAPPCRTTSHQATKRATSDCRIGPPKGTSTHIWRTWPS